MEIKLLLNQVIESAFKAEFILPKTRYVIEECLEEIQEEKESNDQVETNKEVDLEGGN